MYYDGIFFFRNLNIYYITGKRTMRRTDDDPLTEVTPEPDGRGEKAHAPPNTAEDTTAARATGE